MFEKRKLRTFGMKAPSHNSAKSVIRYAYHEEINYLLILVKELAKNSVGFHVHEEKFGHDSGDFLNIRNCLLNAINEDLVIVSVNEKGINGVISGFITDSIFHSNVRILQETVFYARTKRESVLLLKAFFDRFKELQIEKKADFLKIGEIEGISPNYNKFGLNKLERIWYLK